MKYIFIILILSINTVFCGEYSPHLNEVCAEFSKEMFSHYGLICFGDKGSADDKIKEIGLQFRAYHRATLEEARALQVIATRRFHEMINSHEGLRPYLKEYPFSTERIGLSF